MNARIQKYLAWGMALAILTTSCYQIYLLKPKEYVMTFADILFDGGTFINAYDGTDHIVTLSDVYKINEDIEVKDEKKSFTLLDLDSDGTPELILPLVIGEEMGYDNIYGYEILHYADGDTLGYLVWFRGFYNLKTDGSFSSSGGAGDHGIYSISEFSRETYSTKAYAQIESFDAPGTETGIGHICHVDGQEVDAETFDKAVSEWGKKEEVTFQKISKWNWWRCVLK